jgi:hypothetical protein
MVNKIIPRDKQKDKSIPDSEKDKSASDVNKGNKNQSETRGTEKIKIESVKIEKKDKKTELRKKKNKGKKQALRKQEWKIFLDIVNSYKKENEILLKTIFNFPNIIFSKSSRLKKLCLAIFQNSEIPLKWNKRCSLYIKNLKVSQKNKNLINDIYRNARDVKKEILFQFVIEKIPKNQIRVLYKNSNFNNKIHILKHISKSPKFQVTEEQFLEEENHLLFRYQIIGILNNINLKDDEKYDILVKKLKKEKNPAGKISLYNSIHRYFPKKIAISSKEDTLKDLINLYSFNYEASGQNLPMVKKILQLIVNEKNPEVLAKFFLKFLYYPSREIRHLFIRSLSKEQLLKYHYPLYIAFLDHENRQTRALLMRRLYLIREEYKLEHLVFIDFL